MNLEMPESDSKLNNILLKFGLEYIGWYGDPLQTLHNAVKDYPDFFLGYVFFAGLELTSTGTKSASNLITDPLKKAEELSTKYKYSKQELLHYEAVIELSLGKWESATKIWETILLEFPKDVLALKFAHDWYFYMGNLNSTFESVDRVISHYDKDSKDNKDNKDSLLIYGYVCGMYSFGLEENNRFKEAEEYGLKALEINPMDSWACHAVAHVMEMQGRQKEGIELLAQFFPDWSKCGGLACHLFWHWTLYLIEIGSFKEAISLYDNQISMKIESGAMLDLVDGSSFILRIEMENQNIYGRHEKLQNLWKPHIDDHITIFNDMHLAMIMDIKNPDIENVFFNTYPKENDEFSILRINLCKSILHYRKKNYKEAASLIEPVLDKCVKIGGSNAQRDIIQLVYLNSLIFSKNPVVKTLLKERKEKKSNSGLTDRLMNKIDF